MLNKEIKLDNGIVVKGAVLPSINDVEYLPKEILSFPDWLVGSLDTQWYELAFSCEYYEMGFDFRCYAFDELGLLRPALSIDTSNTELKFRDKFLFIGKEFVIISDSMALCTENIGTCTFIESLQAFKVNGFEVESIKEYLDAWYEAEADTQKLQKILASNAEKTSITLEDGAIVVKRAFILSCEEANEVLEENLNIPSLWWLRTRGYDSNQAMYVNTQDNISFSFSSNYVNLPYGVRPALVIDVKPSSFGIGDTFRFGDMDFKIMSGNRALCMTTIGECAFREDWLAANASDYIVSDIRKYVNDWYQCTLESLVSQAEQKDDDSTFTLGNGLAVKGATLLADWEAEKLKKETRVLKDETWWLRSPGVDKSCAAVVDFNGSTKYGCMVDVCCSVRPALILSGVPSTFRVGSVFRLGDKEFEIVSDTYALCTESIGESNFRSDWESNYANDYEVSDIKQFVDKWYEEAIAAPQQKQEVRRYTEEEVTNIVRDIPFSSIRNCDSADEVADLIASMLRESRR